jgi:hypothetical protein
MIPTHPTSTAMDFMALQVPHVQNRAMVVGQATRNSTIVLHEQGELVDLVCLSRWTSCKSSDARRFRCDYLCIFLAITNVLCNYSRVLEGLPTKPEPNTVRI